MPAMRFALSLVYWAWFVGVLLVLFPLCVLLWAATRPFDRRGVVLHRFTSWWGWLYTWPNPAWPLRIEHRERLDDAETYVIVANHQSLLDILELFRIFAHFRWVSKIENFRIPLVGWVMYMNRYIPLRRGRRGSTLRMMRACEDSLNGGTSVLLFPEGTRSETGELRSFKTGAFELARSTRRPILPIVIDGTSRALPKRGFVLRGRHPIVIRVLDPVPPEAFEPLSARELAWQGRELIGGEIERIRAETA